MAPRGRGPATLAATLGLLFLSGFALVGPVRAQVGSAGAEAGISRSFPPAGLPDSAATYLEAGADLSLPVGRGQLFGAGRGGLSVSGESAGDWVVGSLGGRWMFPLSGGLFAGATVVGQAFHVTSPTRYDALTGRIRPELQWHGDRVTVSLRGQGASTRTETEVVDTTGGGGGGPPGLPGGTDPTATTTTVTSDLSQVGGQARIEVDAGPATVWAQGRSVDAELGIYRSAGLGGSATTGPVSWNASVSYWDTPAGGEVAGGVRLTVPLGGGWFASSDGRRRQPNPLLAIPPSTDLSTTLRREFTFDVGSRSAPVYDFGQPTADDRRMVEFRLPRPEADSVELVGGFSDWTPVSMERTNGTWTARVPIAPGVYHFGFRIDGEWFVPDRAPGVVSDDWGRENATLVVPDSGSDG